MLSNQEIESLTKLPQETLVQFVSDIYGMDKMLDKKIDRLILQSNPVKLIKKLTTTLKGLKRRRKFVDYWESREFAAELDFIKSDIMSLYPDHLEDCLKLLELFIGTSKKSIERCDDSNGEVGGVYRSLCECWITVAADYYDQQTQKASVEDLDVLTQSWLNKVKTLMLENEYSLKDGILLGIDKVFAKDKIRMLIADYEQQYDQLVIKERKAKQEQQAKENKNNSYLKGEFSTHFFDIEVEGNKYSFKVSEIARNIENLARALGDVTLFERVYLKHRQDKPLTPYLLEALIEFLVEHGAYEKALAYLHNQWPNYTQSSIDNEIKNIANFRIENKRREEQRIELKRLNWLATIYSKQGDNNKQRQALGEAFEIQVSTSKLKEIMAISSPAEQAKWRKKALVLAKEQPSTVMAIELLIELGEIKLATDTAIARYEELETIHYSPLVQLLDKLPEDTQIIQVISYRSLLNDILNSRRSKAYGIAARYFKKLQQLDAELNRKNISYDSLDTHQQYVQVLTDKHGRKSSFWEKVDN